MNRQELENRMIELDKIVSELYPRNYFQCIIVGGSALLIRNIIIRGTLDVDVLEVSQEVEDVFSQFDFNTKVKALSFCFPYNYLDRLQKINIKTKTIEFFTPSIEDLIVSKLYAYRKKDIEDLKRIKESEIYNTKLLDEIIVEAELSSISERSYKEMVFLYNSMFKE